MKIYKSLLAALLTAIAAVGITSCAGEMELPPTAYPELAGNGSGAAPFNVGAALINIYTGNYTEKKVYVEGIVSQIDSFEPSYGNMTYYISDDGSTTNQLEVYRGLGLNGEKFTSADQLKVGDRVIIYAQLTYYNNSVAETNQGASIVSLNGSPYDYDEPVDPIGDGTSTSPYNVTKALDLIFAGDYTSDKVYVKGKIAKIDGIDTSYGNATYYISDSGSTLDMLEVYRGYGFGGKKFTGTDQIKVGDEVVVYGAVTLYNSTPEFTSGSAIVWCNGTDYPTGDTPDKPDTPTGTTIYEGLTSGIDGWTIYNAVIPEGLENVWTWNDSYKCLYGTAYGAATPDAECYIFTIVDLAGYTDAQLTFDQAAKFQTTLQTLCGPIVRVVGENNWTRLSVPTWCQAGSWTFVNSGAISLKEFAGKKVEIGFVYGSNASGADSWEIKNFVITGSK